MSTLHTCSNEDFAAEFLKRLNGAEATAKAALIKQLSGPVQSTLSLAMMPNVPIVTKNGHGKNGGNGHKKQARKAKKAKSTVAPLYRDTENAANTWSGRGRPPRWMKGRDKAQFRIHA